MFSYCIFVRTYTALFLLSSQEPMFSLRLPPHLRSFSPPPPPPKSGCRAWVVRAYSKSRVALSANRYRAAAQSSSSATTQSRTRKREGDWGTRPWESRDGSFGSCGTAMQDGVPAGLQAVAIIWRLPSYVVSDQEAGGGRLCVRLGMRARVAGAARRGAMCGRGPQRALMPAQQRMVHQEPSGCCTAAGFI